MNNKINSYWRSSKENQSAGRQRRLSFFLWIRDQAIKQFHQRGGLAIAAAAAMVAIAPTAANAADFTVDTLSDVDDDGMTLREAIVAANGNGEADTITFDAGLSGILVLAQGELQITQDLTITGPEDLQATPADERITISGDNDARIFNITNSTAAISNLILTDGNASGDDGVTGNGGAILSTRYSPNT